MYTDPRAFYWERKDGVEGSDIGVGLAKKGGDEDPRDGQFDNCKRLTDAQDHPLNILPLLLESV